MINALWLASWYPGRLDPFNGDFVERHALAVSRYVKLTVIVILKDQSLKANKVLIEKTAHHNLTVYRVYYGTTKMPFWIESLWSVKTYFKLQKQLYRQIEKETGRPDIIHVQVAMKAGMLALYLKKKYRIPFIVTEHWTGYYPQSQFSIYENNFIYKRINKAVLKKADLFLPVSKDLGETVNKNFIPVKYTVVPNVVDTELFFYQPSVPGKFRFIHPSYMNYQKNPEGILKACLFLKTEGYDFELLMVGNEEKGITNLASQTHLLNNCVFFKPMVPYAAIAREMQQSSALLMFSRFENLPCIILEALCCGLPVISSSVGGIPEVVDGANGILVESENVTALAEAMKQVIDNYANYNRVAIAAKAAALFSYNRVGMQYADVYKSVLNKH